jgi:hypothetical protein
MAKFNEKRPTTKTVNRAGGQAYKSSPELELVGILLTSFVKDKFYESAGGELQRLAGIIQSVNKKFAAQSAIYARHEFGMRSITHALASELAPYISGQAWADDFYNSIVRRPDDITEIISYHLGRGEKLSSAMKKGLANAFNKFDGYQLAKYKGEGNKVKLVDALNMIHPRPKDDGQDAIFKKLTEGTLKSKDTWEARISASKGDKQEKKKAWQELLESDRLGYFALLRNLRNILKDAPGSVDLACEKLTDAKRIEKSLVMPFRFLTAMKTLERENLDGIRKVFSALNKALDKSVDNVPIFEGKTLIALDVSGSMTSGLSDKLRPAEIAAVFAMALYKTNDSDFLTFDRGAEYQMINPDDALTTMVNRINFRGGGTNIHSIFYRANKAYDRIVILTDNQGWMGYGTPAKALNDYRKNYDADPIIYDFDFESYGDMQFPESNVYCIQGYSDKVFDIMKLLETDRKALINEIKKIEL